MGFRRRRVKNFAMLEIARSRIAARARRLMPGRFARFARAKDGAAAVEFAMVALPFLALLFAILETALVFFASQSLEATASDSARLIMTGQAQTGVSPTSGSVGYSAQDFKNAACARLSVLFDCNQLYVSVQSYGDFGSAVPGTATPLNTTTHNMTVDVNNLPYSAGSPGSIIVVQLYYQWPILVSLLNGSLPDINGNRLLVATSVFRNEPYQ
jgi:Flp pilus assembly protein TadG